MAGLSWSLGLAQAWMECLPYICLAYTLQTGFLLERYD
jgi:hypothetical protein